MAYVSQEDKKKLAPAIKAVLKKYKMKGSIAVRNHSCLVVNIREGAIPFKDKDHYQVNTYWFEDHYKDNPLLVSFLKELLTAMQGPDYYNNDDAMTDYYDRSHYTDINIGQWNKPYREVV